KWTLSAAAAIAATVLIAVGSVGWVVRDRTSRRTALAREVVRALDEVEAAYKRDALPEADAALRQAEGLLASGGGAAESLARRVHRWRDDRNMVTRLEDLLLEQIPDHA